MPRLRTLFVGGTPVSTMDPSSVYYGKETEFKHEEMMDFVDVIIGGIN